MEENNLNMPGVQSVNPVAPENVSPPPPPIPEPKVQNNSIIIIMFSILLLILIGAVAFLYYQNQQLKGLLTNYQVPVSSPTPVATADPTANWITYLDPNGAYSFRHPDGLNSTDSSGGTGFESIHFTFIGPTQASGKTQTELSDGYTFDVIKLGLTAQLDPKTEANKALENSKQNCNSVSTISNVLIAGVNAFQYSGNCLGTYTTTYLSDGKNTYNINESYTNSSYKTTTDQILSTFKFINPTGSPVAAAITNLKTPIPTLKPTATLAPAPTPTPTSNVVMNQAPNSQRTVYSVTVNSPNGGESLKSGTNTTISWSSTGTFSFFKLYYFDCAGCAGTYITTVNGSQNSYVWYVYIGGVSLPHQEKIRIVGQRSDTSEDTPTDESDNNFTVTN